MIKLVCHSGVSFPFNTPPSLILKALYSLYGKSSIKYEYNTKAETSGFVKMKVREINVSLPCHLLPLPQGTRHPWSVWVALLPGMAWFSEHCLPTQPACCRGNIWGNGSVMNAMCYIINLNMSATMSFIMWCILHAVFHTIMEIQCA